MDSVFTPYNGMFAFVKTKPYKTTTISVKLNNSLVRCTKICGGKKIFLKNPFHFTAVIL